MRNSGLAGERIVAVILHAAYGTNYLIDDLFLTEGRLLAVPIPSATGTRVFFYGVAVTGRQHWRKNAPQGPTLLTVNQDLDPTLVNHARRSIPYEQVQWAEVKKVWGADDTVLKIKAGLIADFWFLHSGVDDIRRFLYETPLREKLRS